MKKYILLFRLLIAFIPAIGQNDLYEGMSKKIPYGQMITPYGVGVTYHKTVHIIFPSAIRYVDLGSNNIIAGKASGVENVLRVKAAIEGFTDETNFSVITEEGTFYSFNAKYTKEPELLNIEMKDFKLSDSQISTYQDDTTNKSEIYFPELGEEAPMLVNIIMQSLYNHNCRHVKHLGSKRFGVQFRVKGIYSHNSLLYIHTETKNHSNVAFHTDFIRFKIVDKKIAKRTAIQEMAIEPVRTHNEVLQVKARNTARTVYALPQVAIPDDKVLVIELIEKNNGRNQVIMVENSDLINARPIDEQKIM